MTIQKKPFLLCVTNGFTQKKVLNFEILQDLSINLDERFNRITFSSKSKPDDHFQLKFVFNFQAVQKYLEAVEVLGASSKHTDEVDLSYIKIRSRIPWISALLVILNIAAIPFWQEQYFLNIEAIKNNHYGVLISYFFVHGGVFHLILNMFALFDLGQKVEATLGKFKFLMIYFISGIASGVFALLWLNEHSLVGASGAIFGLMGVIFCLSRREETAPFFERISKIDLLSCVVISILPGISFSGHFGGFVVGWLMGYFFRKSMQKGSNADTRGLTL